MYLLQTCLRPRAGMIRESYAGPEIWAKSFWHDYARTELSAVTDVIRFHVPSRHLRFCNRNLLRKDSNQSRLHWVIARSLKLHLQCGSIYHSMHISYLSNLA